MVNPMRQKESQETQQSGSGLGLESSLPKHCEGEGADSNRMSRRDALGLLAKHSMYTAPTVLAILSLKSKQVQAGCTGTIVF